MPIILNPEKDNFDLTKAGTDFTTAIFGSAADRANRDVRASQLQNNLAEAEVNRIKAKRGEASYQQFIRLPQIRQALVRPEGMSNYEWRLRSAEAEGQQMMVSPEGTPDSYAKAGTEIMGQGYLQGNTGDDLRLAANAFGRNPGANDAFNGQELKQFQNADFAKTDRTAQASEYGSRQTAAAARYGHDLTHKADEDRIAMESNRPSAVNDTATLLIPTASPFHAQFGDKYEGRGTAAGGKTQNISSKELDDVEATVAKSVTNAYNTKNPKKPYVEPAFVNSLDPNLRVQARAAAQERLQHGDVAGAERAYRDIAQIPQGSTFHFPKTWYGSEDTDAKTGKGSIERPGQQGGMGVVTPLVQAATGGGPSYAPQADFRAPTLAPVPQSSGPISSAVFGQRTAAPQPSAAKAPAERSVAQSVTQPASAPAAPAVKPYQGPRITGNDDPVYKALYPGDKYIAPDGTPKYKPLVQRGTAYMNAPVETSHVTATRETPAPVAAPQTSAVSVSASKTPAESAIAQAVTRPARAPAPVYSESDANAALAANPNDGRALALLGRYAPAPPTVQVFNDPGTARQEAYNPNQDAAARRAAQAYNLQSQTPKSVALRPIRKPTTFTDPKTANDALAGSRAGSWQHTNAQNYFDNANAGIH